MSIRSVVKRWFDERPEYANSKPTSVAPLIAREVTMGDAQENVERAVADAIRQVAKAEGKNAVKDSDGRTVYVDPVSLNLRAFIVDYLVQRKEEARADRRKTLSVCSAWCEAHPEAGLTGEQLYNMDEADLAA